MLRRGVAGAGGRLGRRPVRVAIALLCAIGAFAAMAAPAMAAPDPSKVGDLTGNFSPATYLLIPLALVLALITAIALGPRGEPGAAAHRAGGLERALSGRDAPSDRRPS
jgi:hypothetical protein